MSRGFDRPYRRKARDRYARLFEPRSIALIGQSNDAGKTAGRPLKFLRQAGLCRPRSIP